MFTQDKKRQVLLLKQSDQIERLTGNLKLI